MGNISIIIPIYNAEKTIERTLASFISNKDYIKEVILVNDRTNDNTFEKIDSFKTFFEIKIIDNQGNKGPGPSRKAGLLAATGDWVTFVDADDCLTPSSLYYVNNKLQEFTDIVLLHSKTIYYETGSFDPSAIEFSDYSCGGNFYKRKYLIQNNLFPHDELFMVEDEYYNHIVIKFINTYGTNSLIERYDYPVYEVHHDWDEEVSFSFTNWGRYLCKYRLKYLEYYSEFFKNDQDIKEDIKTEVLNGVIFCFLLYESLKDGQFEFDEEEALKAFYDIFIYIMKTYDMPSYKISDYYYNNVEMVHELYKGACASVGNKFAKIYSFKGFLDYILAIHGENK